MPKAYRKLASQSFLVEGQEYASLENFCQAYSFDWDWNNISHQLFLANPRFTISSRCGSDMVLVNGSVKHLGVPLLVKNSNVVIPLELAKMIDGMYITRPEGRILKIKTVVIDPGHGGEDPGAIGVSGIKEKDITLDVALKLKRLLESEGVKVIMTREDDRFISLWRRTHIANNSGADFFVSIHANASHSRYPCGFEVYYLSDAKDNEARNIAAEENAVFQFEESSIDTHSTSLDSALYDLYFDESRAEAFYMANILCKTATQELNIKNRGVKTARFYVLKGVRIPAVLVEVGFVSNRAEEKKLKDSYHRKCLASALASGILQYRKTFESTNGFTN